MPEVLFRVRAFFASRLRAGLWAAYSGLHVLILWVPVVRVPGYELATSHGLLSALAGGLFAAACARLEGSRVVSEPARQAWFAFASAWALLVVPPLLSLLAAMALTTFGSACSPFAGLGFWPLIVLPSITLAGALGTWVGFVQPRWWKASLAWLGLVLLSAAHTAWPIVFGPQVSAWNHLAGFLPGPLYDEELHVPSALVWFRLGSVLLAFIALVTTARRLGDRTRAGRVARALAVVAVLGLEGLGPRLGFRQSDAALEARLGGRSESANIVLIHPRGLTPAEVARALDDLEFRFEQIAQFVGGAPPGRVTVWWYRSAEQKQALVGASHTQFAKPWRREVHLNDSGFPHPVAKHELAHAMLAPLGAPPFGVTARLFGLSPHVGVIEGLAVAADDPVDELSLQEWAAAMKRQHLLPDVRTLLEPQGFYSAPASRAYTTAGAFLRWLRDERGPEKLKALYRDGDFERVYGEGLPPLVSAWEAFLDSVPLQPEAVNQAFARFRRGSLFDRPCAREVASLSSEAHRLAPEDAPGALAVLSRCEALQPAEPSHVLARAAALRRLGRTDDAKTVLEALAARVADAPSTWADAAMALVELALARGDVEAARSLLTRVVELQVSPGMDRTARVRLHGLDAPEPVRTAIDRWFSSDAEAVQVHWLERAHVAAPTDSFVAYLLGRRLHQRESWAEALSLLEQVRVDDTLPASVRKETLRLMLEAAFGAKDCARLDALALDARKFPGALNGRANDWKARCARTRW